MQTVGLSDFFVGSYAAVAASAAAAAASAAAAAAAAAADDELFQNKGLLGAGGRVKNYSSLNWCILGSLLCLFIKWNIFPP